MPGTAILGDSARVWLLRHTANTLSQVKSTVAESPGHPSFQTVYQLWTADKTCRMWTRFFVANAYGLAQGPGPGQDILVALGREYLQMVAVMTEWTRLIDGGHAALEASFSFDGWFSVFGAQLEDFEQTAVKDMKKWQTGSCALTRHLVRPAQVVHVHEPVHVPVYAPIPVVAPGGVPGIPPGGRGGGGVPRGGRGRGRGGGPHPLWPLHVATHLIAARARPAVTVPPAPTPPGCCHVCHGADHFASAPCPN